MREYVANTKIENKDGIGRELESWLSYSRRIFWKCSMELDFDLRLRVLCHIVRSYKVANLIRRKYAPAKATMHLLAHFHRDPFFDAWSRKSLVFHGLTPTIPELRVLFPGEPQTQAGDVGASPFGSSSRLSIS